MRRRITAKLEVQGDSLKLRSFSLLILVSPLVFGQSVNPKPVKELGAPRLIATQANPLAVDTTNPNWIEGKEVYNPSGVAIDNSSSTPGIWVTDTRNNRVLGWRTAQVSPGQPADVILGQANQYQTLVGGPGGTSSQGLNAPTGIAVDPLGNVYVADSNNNRVLRFPTPFATSLTSAAQIFPDIVIGQTSFNTNGANQGGISNATLSLNTGTTVPLFAGLAFDTAGSLYVADVNNNRVLVFPASVLKSQNNGPAANLVLGQVNFTSTTPAPNGISASAFTKPSGIAIDLNGRLYVGDSLGRVLVFLPPFVIGSSAARFVGIQTQIQGQPAPPAISNTTVGYPQGIAIAANRLVVVDAADSRALVFDVYANWPDPSVAISPSAYEIIGQPSYSGSSPNQGAYLPTAASLNVPIGAAATSASLFIADGGNNRVTAYPLQSGIPALGATYAIGQNYTNVNAPNLIEGKEFNLISSIGVTGSVLIDRSATPPHLYVSDTANNRILCFNDAGQVNAGATADLVIGQANGVTSEANFPTGNPAKPSSSGLNSPAGLALDASGNLWVADSGNGRVLRFPAPFAQSGGGMPTANLVIGQASFTAQITNASPTNMHTPVSLAFTSDGSLAVSDAALNRILFFQQPLSTGMAAAKVIGQTDFYSSSPNGTPADPARFTTPLGIATDAQDRIYVCDSGGVRVVIFGAPTYLSTSGATPLFSLSQGLIQPISVTIGPSVAPLPGEVWVADAGLNALVHYPPFAQLSQSSAANSEVPVFTPLSITYDAYGNLVVADGTNRVLFYAPLISISNAANYLTNAVAPGTIVSIFPSPSTSNNVLGTATANFNSLANPIPLPTALGGVEVLLNLIPTQLFYVSPTQINLPLPFTLPSSGTVDVRVVNQSTGQIYGAADMTMTPLSPGLFTLNGAGFGQLAALNDDYTVNGPGNPLTRGHIIQIFGTGQGSVSSAPAAGMLDTGLAPTAVTPVVQISTVTVPPANIMYSGLAPGLVGVWQLNVLVPTTVTAGSSVPVVVTMNGVPSNNPSNPASLKTTIALQ
jgi:uncharacterized protein (TIGR03437 family)